MKVTYLFGAGASKNALPIVNEIPDRISNVIKLLREPPNQLSNEIIYHSSPEKSERDVQEQLILDLEWLQLKLQSHASIDTFAKKLFIKDQITDLKRLKASFSAYLTIEESLRQPDIRYDVFFASILKNTKHDFPDNIRIISWNYDSQFEKSYYQYSDKNNIYENQSILNIGYHYRTTQLKKDRFCILKINGTTTLIENDSIHNPLCYCDHFSDQFDMSVLRKVILEYSKIFYSKKKYNLGLSYAWENNLTSNQNIVNIAKLETKHTDILIVIGYSFPYFNREVDRFILGSISPNKVFFQSPEADNLKERFASINPNIESDKLHSIKDLKQFYLPNEL